MKSIKYFTTILLLSVLFAFSACEGFLDHTPRGAMSEEDMDDPARLEGLIIAAYAALGNDHWSVPYGTNWVFGSMRADDSYKGGGGIGDQQGFHFLETFSATDAPNIGNVDGMWFHSYQAISRANSALRGINKLDEDEPRRDEMAAEMKFIRGHFHFILKTHFKHIPFIDETMNRQDIENESNRALSDQELWTRIAEDFRFAVEHLPVNQQDVGRPDVWAAKSYLAKVLLYQAYRQDDSHQLVEIQTDLLNEVVDLTDEVIMSSGYGLFDDIGKNFLQQYDNGPESIFAVQRSYDDGTEQGRVGADVGLNYPVFEAFGCCWFNIPSQSLTNAFQTNEDGLPLFNDYNSFSFSDASHFEGEDITVDPRLNHTVSITGFPFKYDEELIYNESTWARTQSIYGPFTSMRELMHPDDPTLQEVGFYYASAKNTDIIRFADVLLWRAEALMELGRLQEALDDINEVRQRASNSTQRLNYEDGEYFTEYQVDTYQPGININLSLDEVRRALRWERRLEFAMEGKRFFDLVRWGIAEEVMNQYFSVESDRRDYLQNSVFTAGRDEYLPISQSQILWSDGLYQQNPGYPGGN